MCFIKLSGNGVLFWGDISRREGEGGGIINHGETGEGGGGIVRIGVGERGGTYTYLLQTG